MKVKWNVHVTQHWGLSHSSATCGIAEGLLLTPSEDEGTPSKSQLLD